jgi:hypothetical protein
MNVFFELGDYAVKDFGGKYFALYNATKGEVMRPHERYLMMYSERVWAEDDHGVRFMKNRYEYADNEPVDIPEFVWVKLKSRPM